MQNFNGESTLSDNDSLFEDPEDVFMSLPGPELEQTSTGLGCPTHCRGQTPALRTAPPIPGLWYDPSRLCIPQELSDKLLETIDEMQYFGEGVNQVMLFGLHDGSGSGSGGLPLFLKELVRDLEPICRRALPRDTCDVLFPPTLTIILHEDEGGERGSDQRSSGARQAILNRYLPGEGISPHVDLLGRYGDGIIGISLGSGCVMRFKKVGPPSDVDMAMSGLYPPAKTTPGGGCEGEDEHAVYLPPNSIIILEKEARYEWAHGIERLYEDLVETLAEGDLSGKKTQWIERGLRTSITLRWLLPGADVVGS